MRGWRAGRFFFAAGVHVFGGDGDLGWKVVRFHCLAKKKKPGKTRKNLKTAALSAAREGVAGRPSLAFAGILYTLAHHPNGNIETPGAVAVHVARGCRSWAARGSADRGHALAGKLALAYAEAEAGIRLWYGDHVPLLRPISRKPSGSLIDAREVTDGTIVEPELWPCRGVAEHAYCPRLFYYMTVEGVFAPSADTEQGAGIHRRVDQPSAAPAEPGTKNGRAGRKAAEKLEETEVDPSRPRAVRSLALTSARLGLTARLDLAEIDGTRAIPVEYRKGRPNRSGQVVEATDEMLEEPRLLPAPAPARRGRRWPAARCACRTRSCQTHGRGGAPVAAGTRPAMPALLAATHLPAG